MSRLLSIKEGLKIAAVTDRPAPGELAVRYATMGRVEVDESKCNGCQWCVKACPAGALEMDGPKNVRMIGDNAPCIACSDCVAICKPIAIQLVRPMTYDGFYKHAGRGKLSGPRRF